MGKIRIKKQHSTKKIGTAHGMGALKQLHGKELSYNNIVDMEAAWNMVWGVLQTLQHVSLSIQIHVAQLSATTLHDAYVNAYEADSVSAFGGIVALNREVDAAYSR